MQPPAITRHRRPFLAPIWLFAALVVISAGVLVGLWRSAAITTVIVTRHAEREAGADPDPPLSPTGERRALALARLFGGADASGRIEAIYVSDTRRARQTAAPLASRLGVEPIVLAAGDIGAAAARIQRAHRGRTVLVVGHSNTVPGLVRELSGLEIAAIGEDEYDRLYIVSVPTFGRSSLVQMRY